MKIITFLLIWVCASHYTYGKTKLVLTGFSYGSAEVQTGLTSTSSIDFTPGLGFEKEWEINNKLSFTPSIGYIFNSSSSDFQKKTRIYTMANWGYKFFLDSKSWAIKNLSFKGGLGLVRESIEGDGGQVLLNNGGSTKSFQLPKGIRSTYTSSINLGLESSWKRLSLEFLTLINKALNSDKRSVDLLLSLKYRL